MIRPPAVNKAFKENNIEVLKRYINKLEENIKEYEEIDYKQGRLDLIAINETIKEKNKLIEDLTNLLEPKVE